MEQDVAVSEEQRRGLTEQPAAVADETSTAVADPTSETVAAFDLSTPDGIRKAAEQYPQLKAWREEGYGAGIEAGRVRALAEREREDGSVERANAYNEWVIQQLQNGANPEELKKQTPLFVSRNLDYLKGELSKAWVESTLSHYDAADADLIRGVLEGLDGQPDEIVKLASKTIDAVTSKVRTKAVADLDLDAVPKESKLSAQIQERIDAGVRSELEAQALEAKRQPNAPRVRGNAPGSVGMTPEQALAMAPEQVAALSPEDHALWKDAFFAGSAARA